MLAIQGRSGSQFLENCDTIILGGLFSAVGIMFFVSLGLLLCLICRRNLQNFKSLQVSKLKIGFEFPGLTRTFLIEARSPESRSWKFAEPL